MRAAAAAAGAAARGPSRHRPKRDIALLERVPALAGDTLTVLDISLDAIAPHSGPTVPGPRSSTSTIISPGSARTRCCRFTWTLCGVLHQRAGGPPPPGAHRGWAVTAGLRRQPAGARRPAASAGPGGGGHAPAAPTRGSDQLQRLRRQRSRPAWCRRRASPPCCARSTTRCASPQRARGPHARRGPAADLEVALAHPARDAAGRGCAVPAARCAVGAARAGRLRQCTEPAPSGRAHPCCAPPVTRIRGERAGPAQRPRRRSAVPRLRQRWRPLGRSRHRLPAELAARGVRPGARARFALDPLATRKIYGVRKTITSRAFVAAWSLSFA